MEHNIHTNQNIATSPMTGRTLSLMFRLLHNLTSLGGSLRQEGGRGSTGHSFSKQAQGARILNDNYCNKDPLVRVDLSVLAQNQSCQIKLSRTVYLRPVVTHFPFVIGTRQLQKKGLSPAPCLTEI